MLNALTLLFLCQLAGEVIVQALGLTFPGPVLGMGLLFGGPARCSATPAPTLDAVADTILKSLSLLFVPGGGRRDAAGRADRRQLAGDLRGAGGLDRR